MLMRWYRLEVHAYIIKEVHVYTFMRVYTSVMADVYIACAGAI